jgi:hypothetical protein
MKWSAVIFVAAGVFSFDHAMAASSMRADGLIKVESAVQITDGTTQKTEISLLPRFELRDVFGVDISMIGRLRSDWSDRLEPGQPEQNGIDPWTRRYIGGERTDAELRELYAEIYLANSYLKLGKQQVVWGKADGLKVLDRVNPQSFREFILADFETSRIPLWTVNWEFDVSNDWNGQLLFIPDQTYHDIPAAGSVYAPTSPELLPNIPADRPVIDAVRSVPDRTLADADAGLQLSTRKNGWDLTLNYLYHYADAAVTRVINLDAGIRLETSYERTHTFGGSASNAFGDVTVRAELGYATDRYIQSMDPQSNDGLIYGGELAYLLGLDWVGLRNTLISMQLFQSWFDRNGEAASRDSVETDMTLLIERRFLNDVVVLRQQLIHDVDTEDGLASFSLSYDYLANLVLRVEADIFYGTENGRFGQYDTKDRILVGFEYGY